MTAAAQPRHAAPALPAGGATTGCDVLTDEMGAAFTRACAELSRARRRRQEKDDRANRAAVAEWLARIDLVLDMFLALAGPGRELTGPAGRPDTP